MYIRDENFGGRPLILSFKLKGILLFIAVTLVKENPNYDQMLNQGVSGHKVLLLRWETKTGQQTKK